jgi:hypothetical protein
LPTDLAKVVRAGVKERAGVKDRSSEGLPPSIVKPLVVLGGVMGDVPPQMQFLQEIRWMIQRNTRFGGTGVVRRLKVEKIGANLGMLEVAACEQFLAVQGSLWDVYNGSLAFCMSESTETNRLEPVRRWVAINDVIVLGL